jgi:hypothetical protein
MKLEIAHVLTSRFFPNPFLARLNFFGLTTVRCGSSVNSHDADQVVAIFFGFERWQRTPGAGRFILTLICSITLPNWRRPSAAPSARKFSISWKRRCRSVPTNPSRREHANDQN